jgi:hypothetical protein
VSTILLMRRRRSRFDLRQAIEPAPGTDLSALEDLGEDLVARQVEGITIPERAGARDRCGMNFFRHRSDRLLAFQDGARDPLSPVAAPGHQMHPVVLRHLGER